MNVRLGIVGLAALTVGSSTAEGQTCPSSSTACSSLSTEIVDDSWSPKIAWVSSGHYDWEAQPIHASLVTVDGETQVFFFGFRTNGGYADPYTSDRWSWLMGLHPIGGPYPMTETATNIDQPLVYCDHQIGELSITDTLFCAGHSLLRDGRVFTAGGTRQLFNTTTMMGAGNYGLGYATIFDANGTWDLVGDAGACVCSGDDTCLTNPMIGTGATDKNWRWYPSVTRLHDERMLVVAGHEITGGPMNLSVEAYDAASDSWTLISDHDDAPPEIFSSNYPHPVVLPTRIDRNGTLFDVMIFGGRGRAVLLSLTAAPPNQWWASTNERPGSIPQRPPNGEATSLLLPLRLDNGVGGEWDYPNGSFLTAGGGTMTVCSAEQIDVYDPFTDTWPYSMALGIDEDNNGTPDAHARGNTAGILLPDGRVAIVGGYDPNDPANTCTQYALYVDPRTKHPTIPGRFEVRRGDELMGEFRAYHTVALLLPDGRVLVGSGEDSINMIGQEKNDFRYLSPPYMQAASRPTIVSAPASLPYGVLRNLKADIPHTEAEVVLMALGSFTHNYDFDQRYVQLEVLPPQSRYTAVPWIPGTTPPAPVYQMRIRGPADARSAPPGRYMLFVLDGNRVPSVAKIIDVG